MENDVRQSEADRLIARANRERLDRAGAFAVNVAGGLGCGKTSLFDATVDRLASERRVGVVSADPGPGRGTNVGTNVVHVDPGFGRALCARHVEPALVRLCPGGIDLLLIENVGSLAGPDAIDLGEHARVAIFSVAAGHGKATEHPNIVRWADVVLLNKVDLLAGGGFDLRAFRAALGRLNAGAEYFELSTRTGEGLDAWIAWLRARPPSCQPTSH
jgi:hydrogenase nickel incorporation protein HypB